jgi:thiosulfate/3-mercaptopyruvate sulfurtransferase
MLPSVYGRGNLGEHLGDVDFVAERVGNPKWVILDGRGAADYEKGHIPGAVNFGKAVVTVLKHPVDGRVVSLQEGEKLLSAIGMTNDKGLIVYGKKADYHVICEFFPSYLGVKDFVYLDGGYEAWMAAGEKVETGKVSPVPGDFKGKVARPKLYVTTEEMLRIVKEKPANTTLIDTRSSAEFRAEENTILRGGRIPGAISIPVEQNLDPNTGKMLPKRLLTEVYKEIPKENRIIFYCHRGCRTGYGFIALELLGYKNVSIYEDSYIVWGSLPHTSVEHEHYINLRPTVSGLDALRARIEKLEKDIEELRSKK